MSITGYIPFFSKPIFLEKKDSQLSFQVAEETAVKVRLCVSQSRCFITLGTIALTHGVFKILTAKMDFRILFVFLEVFMGSSLCKIGFEMGKIEITPVHGLFLTGRLEEKSIHSTDPLLQVHLKFAKEVISYVLNTIIFSSNQPRNRSVSIEELKQENKKLRFIRSREDSNYSLKHLEIIKKYKVGNCQEMSFLGYQYANIKKEAPRVEIFEITGGDHVFLVIGRDVESLFSDYKSWGQGCVVCDPWSGSFYPASEIEKYLRNYVRVVEINGHAKTLVQPFNLKIHQLNLFDAFKDQV